MSGFADIYVIKKTRLKKFGIEFLDHFLPQRKESSDEYLFPQYTDKVETEFQNAESLMDYLEKYPNSEYGIYWRNLDSDNLNRYGMLFYTPDSYMIFGISRYPLDFNNKSNEEECLAEMKNFLETDEGYITYECPPENTYSEFVHLINQYNQSKNL
jgi:hypothetical protein